MGMKGNNFGQKCELVFLKKPTTINSGGTATFDTAAISLALPKARQVCFLAQADVPAASGLTIKLIGKKKSDAAWELITDKAAATIEFPTAKLADGTAVETAGLLGVIDLEDMKGDSKYSDIALRCANSAATDVILSVMALLVDFMSVPTSQSDEFAAVVFA